MREGIGLDDIDYTELNLVDNFTYDTQPNEKGEILIAFKVGDKSYVMPIPRRDLKRMLWYAEKDIMCVDCGNEERNPGLDVCGSCYHEQIFGEH